MEWVTWPPPLFPAVGACPLFAPASLRQHSGGAVALSAVTERKKHSLRSEGLRHIENPVQSHRRRIYKHLHTYLSPVSASLF